MSSTTYTLESWLEYDVYRSQQHTRIEVSEAQAVELLRDLPTATASAEPGIVPLHCGLRCTAAGAIRCMARTPGGRDAGGSFRLADEVGDRLRFHRLSVDGRPLTGPEMEHLLLAAGRYGEGDEWASPQAAVERLMAR